MKKIIYFTQGPVATTTELNDILTIQQEIVTTHSLSVFNENESPNFGAGPAPADYANGTVPATYSHLPKFTGVGGGGGGLSMPGFLLPLQPVTPLSGEEEQEIRIPLAPLGLSSGYNAGMRISNLTDMPSFGVEDTDLVLSFYGNETGTGYMLIGLDKYENPSFVLPIQIL